VTYLKPRSGKNQDHLDLENLQPSGQCIVFSSGSASEAISDLD
jgi:hypothetical protein